MLCLSGLGLPDSRDAKLLCGSFGAGGEDTAVCYMTVLGPGIEDTGAFMWQLWGRGVRIRDLLCGNFGAGV